MWGGYKQVQMSSDNEKVYLLQSCYYIQHFAGDARGVVKPGKHREESAAPTFIIVCSLPAEDWRPVWAIQCMPYTPVLLSPEGQF